MVTETKDRYTAQCFFQNDLDQAFPQGAVCAVLPLRDGRVRPGGWLGTTGRVFCSDARPVPQSDQWEYEILIDTRVSPDQDREELRIWVGALASHPFADGLWESPIDTDGDEQMLRLNANATGDDGPTEAMRSAVIEVHERALFPDGLRS